MTDRDAYLITPGKGEIIRFDKNLTGLCDAMSNAKYWSVGGQAQEVWVIRDGESKRLFEYRDGRETFRSCAGLVPAAPAPPVPVPAGDAEVIELRSRRLRSRRRPKLQAAWPGTDINDPPCN
jgi:hypothetical protein